VRSLLVSEGAIESLNCFQGKAIGSLFLQYPLLLFFTIESWFEAHVLVEPDIHTLLLDPAVIPAHCLLPPRPSSRCILYGKFTTATLLKGIAGQHGLKVVKMRHKVMEHNFNELHCGVLGDAAGFGFYPGGKTWVHLAMQGNYHQR